MPPFSLILPSRPPPSSPFSPLSSDLQAFNWSKAADYIGKVTTVALIALPIVGFFIPGGSVGIDLWTIFAGFLLASIELPVIFVCVPICGKFRARAVEMIFFANGLLRLLLYVVLSILCFQGDFFTIFPGALLILTGVFYAGGWLVGKIEEKENANGASYNPVPGERVPISAQGGGATPGLWNGTPTPAPAASGGKGYDF